MAARLPAWSSAALWPPRLAGGRSFRAAPPASQHVQVQLVPEVESIRPGERFRSGCSCAWSRSGTRTGRIPAIPACPRASPGLSRRDSGPGPSPGRSRNVHARTGHELRLRGRGAARRRDHASAVARGGDVGDARGAGGLAGVPRGLPARTPRSLPRPARAVGSAARRPRSGRPRSRPRRHGCRGRPRDGRSRLGETAGRHRARHAARRAPSRRSARPISSRTAARSSTTRHRRPSPTWSETIGWR